MVFDVLRGLQRRPVVVVRLAVEEDVAVPQQRGHHRHHRIVRHFFLEGRGHPQHHVVAVLPLQRELLDRLEGFLRRRGDGELALPGVLGLGRPLGKHRAEGQLFLQLAEQFLSATLGTHHFAATVECHRQGGRVQEGHVLGVVRLAAVHRAGLGLLVVLGLHQFVLECRDDEFQRGGTIGFDRDHLPGAAYSQALHGLHGTRFLRHRVERGFLHVEFFLQLVLEFFAFGIAVHKRNLGRRHRTNQHHCNNRPQHVDPPAERNTSCTEGKCPAEVQIKHRVCQRIPVHDGTDR